MMKWFDIMDKDSVEKGIEDMLRKAIRNAAYYDNDPEQGGQRIPRNKSVAFQEMIKKLEEVTGLPYVPTDDSEQMKVVRYELYSKELKAYIERRQWNSGLETDNETIRQFRQIWLENEIECIARWKSETPKDRPEIIIELNKYSTYIAETIKSIQEEDTGSIQENCTADYFKTDISELCGKCPLIQYISSTISEQIIFQAKHQKEILTDSQFIEYCNIEIKDAQKEMMKTSLLVQQDKDDPKFRTTRTQKFIWNKERIKALNRIQADLPLKDKHTTFISTPLVNNPIPLIVDKSQNFLNEISIVEQKIEANGNDKFIRKMFSPNLYQPVATLWELFKEKGSKETKDLFREAVEEYINSSKKVADKLVDDYEKERKKQPERKKELLIENRDWYVKRLSDVYVPIDNWYHNFWDEYTESVNNIEALETEIFLFCYQKNKQFMVGLRLLRDLYGYYRAIRRFNELIQQSYSQSTSATSVLSANDEQIKTSKDTLEKCFEHTSKYISVMGILAERGYCDPLTHIWKDRGSGFKGMVVELIKHLHTQGFYGKEGMPKSVEIVNIAKNTFGVDLGIDIVKRTKPGQNFKFIGPASIF